MWLVASVGRRVNSGVRFLSVNNREILKGDFVMNRHQICAAVVCFLALVVSANVAYAQSKNIDNPTPLNSNEIVGSVDSDAKGNTFYYSFWASPGEVSVTLTVTPGKAVNDSFLPALTTTTVEFSLFDRNAEKLADKSATANLSVGSRQAVARVEITIAVLTCVRVSSRSA